MEKYPKIKLLIYIYIVKLLRYCSIIENTALYGAIVILVYQRVGEKSIIIIFVYIKNRIKDQLNKNVKIKKKCINLFLCIFMNSVNTDLCEHTYTNFSIHRQTW